MHLVQCKSELSKESDRWSFMKNYCFVPVPLEPLSPRIRNVSSRHLELTWAQPSNARTLGSELLGYRVTVANVAISKCKFSFIWENPPLIHYGVKIYFAFFL